MLRNHHAESSQRTQSCANWWPFGLQWSGTEAVDLPRRSAYEAIISLKWCEPAARKGGREPFAQVVPSLKLPSKKRSFQLQFWSRAFTAQACAIKYCRRPFGAPVANTEATIEPH
jgi:hypothetical protein